MGRGALDTAEAYIYIYIYMYVCVCSNLALLGVDFPLLVVWKSFHFQF